ncbi:hypothetical protein B0H13DRAFT_1932775 [Mycena leptocephala]|nr:hypothetical protein B0H13DRAFT_1932775 [Mycena leptocephala]
MSWILPMYEQMLQHLTKASADAGLPSALRLAMGTGLVKLKHYYNKVQNCQFYVIAMNGRQGENGTCQGAFPAISGIAAVNRCIPHVLETCVWHKSGTQEFRIMKDAQNGGMVLVQDRNIQLKSSSITDCVLCLLLSAQLRLFLVDQQFLEVNTKEFGRLNIDKDGIWRHKLAFRVSSLAAA